MKQAKLDRFMILQLFIAVLVISISIYSKVTENYSTIPWMLFLLGGLIFTIGLREYKRTRRTSWGIIYLCISLFILLTAVKVI